MTTKLLRTKRAGAFHPIERPWVRSGGAWLPASKVYRKESGAWVEWWPLRPLPPTNVTAVFSYRNDRIEVDIDWTAPVGGPDIATYTVEVEPGPSTRQPSPIISATVIPTAWSPDYAWQWLSHNNVRVRVYATSPTGMTGDSAYSTLVVVPQLPPPPVPTAVDVVVLSDRRGILSWGHVGGNRLSSFETRTTYQGSTQVRTVDKIEDGGTPSTWDLDVTAWDPSPTPGDPGGTVSALVRALGPGGTSDWASDSDVIPYVPLPPPPPPVVIVPGTVAPTARFYNGEFIVDYTCPGATSVMCWWESVNEGVGNGGVYLGSFAPSGRITVPGSSAWARDEVTQYRFQMEGVSSTGTHGVLSLSSWCRKLPNPFLVQPTDYLAWRGDAEYNDGLLRQGQSYNEFNPFSPTIQWVSYAFYGSGMDQAFNPARIGYALTVTSAEVLLWRTPTGGSGGSVAPNIGYHTATTKSPVGVYDAGAAYPMARNEARWQPLRLDYARSFSVPGAAKGVGIFHPNTTVSGEVSAEYAKFYGPSAQIFGVPMWTVQFYHDG